MQARRPEIALTLGLRALACAGRIPGDPPMPQSWLQRLFGRKTTTHRGTGRRAGPRQRYRPSLGLEVLEGRVVPAGNAVPSHPAPEPPVVGRSAPPTAPAPEDKLGNYETQRLLSSYNE